MVECDRLQPGEPVAAAGAAEEDRSLVFDQLAATAGEDRRAVSETCPVPLAPVSRRASDAPLVRGDIAADLGVAFACGVAIDFWREAGEEEGREGKVSVQPAGKQASSGFGSGGQAQNDRLEAYYTT